MHTHTATTLLLLVATAHATCPVINHNQLNIAPCSQCTANNFVDGNTEVCGYCYATKSCQEITVGNMITGPCPAPTPTPSTNPLFNAVQTTKPKDPRYDYSLGTNGECDCRPEVYTNCSSCASLEHLGCTWVDSGTQYRTWKVPVFGSLVSHDQDLSLNNTCQSILSPEIKHYELLNGEGDLVFSLDTHTKVENFYWAQCNVSNSKFGALMVGLFILCAGACGAACACLGMYRMCCKKKRQKLQGVYYGAPSQNTTLLDASGRPVLVAHSAGRFA